MSGDPAVELRGLRKTYRETVAVDDVSLSLAPGSFTVLLGPSGCGKSTTLGAVAGLVAPDAGTLRIGGQDMGGVPAERRPVSLVMQKPLLFGHLDVAGNVGFGLRMRREPRAQVAAAVAEALGWVHLTGYAARRVGELSGGQEQRVALARALVLRPDVLLLDEPFSQLDDALRREMRGLLRDLHRRTGTTVLFVTHDLDEALELGEQIVLLREGRVEAAGTPEQLFTSPPTLAAARATGVANELTGSVSDAVFTSTGGSLRLRAPCPDGPAVLVARAEQVELVPEGPGVPATVVEARFAGDHVTLVLRADGGERVHARAAVGAAPPVGDRVVCRLRSWHAFAEEGR